MDYYQMTGFMGSDEPADPSIEAVFPDLDKAALFLDFDGTLVDIADKPDAVHVSDKVTGLLARAMDRLDGRCGLVSGRTIADLEHFLPDFTGVMIGAHGAERRLDGATRSAIDVDPEKIDTLQRVVGEFARLETGFLVEDKPTGVVLHYRQTPERAAVALRFMESLAAATDGMRLQPALMAYELKPEGVGKDVALTDLFEDAKFADATPIYAGDDLTDEPALDLVQSRGGVAIKIGDCDTVAAHRMAGPSQLLKSLEAWLA